MFQRPQSFLIYREKPALGPGDNGECIYSAISDLINVLQQIKIFILAKILYKIVIPPIKISLYTIL